jgi:hypothetical protein
MGVGRIRNTNNILVKNPEWDTPLWRSKCRWEDNIKTKAQKCGLDSIG